MTGSGWLISFTPGYAWQLTVTQPPLLHESARRKAVPEAGGCVTRRQLFVSILNDCEPNRAPACACVVHSILRALTATVMLTIATVLALDVSDETWSRNFCLCV